MTPTFILASLVLLGCLLVMLGLPYLAPRQRLRRGFSNQDLSLVDLDDQLHQNIAALRDLDLDFDMGKLAPEDYAHQRKYLIGRGVSLMLRWEALRQQQGAQDAELEALISAYRQQKRAG
jgi:hypothetical protein